MLCRSSSISETTCTKIFCSHFDFSKDWTIYSLGKIFVFYNFIHEDDNLERRPTAVQLKIYCFLLFIAGQFPQTTFKWGGEPVLAQPEMLKRNIFSVPSLQWRDIAAIQSRHTEDVSFQHVRLSQDRFPASLESKWVGETDQIEPGCSSGNLSSSITTPWMIREFSAIQ